MSEFIKAIGIFYKNTPIRDKKRLVACEDRYMNSLPMPSDMGYI